MAPVSTNLLEPNLDDAYHAWKAAPSPDANARLLKHLEPTIRMSLKQHIGDDSPLLYSKARKMALEGVHSYDPEKGSLKTHIYNHLQGMKRVARKQHQILSVPERVSLERAQLEQAGSDLEHELGREPTDAELMEHLGLSPRRLKRLRQFQPAVAESRLEDPETGESYAGSVQSAEPIYPSAWSELVYNDLDPYHQAVMEHSLGLHGREKLSNLEIAAKLKRSPGAISQAKARIQQILDDEKGLNPF